MNLLIDYGWQGGGCNTESLEEHYRERKREIGKWRRERNDAGLCKEERAIKVDEEEGDVD